MSSISSPHNPCVQSYETGAGGYKLNLNFKSIRGVLRYATAFILQFFIYQFLDLKVDPLSPQGKRPFIRSHNKTIRPPSPCVRTLKGQSDSISGSSALQWKLNESNYAEPRRPQRSSSYSVPKTGSLDQSLKGPNASQTTRIR